MANSVDLDEVAHSEAPHKDLRCLQIQLFMSLVHRELNFKSRFHVAFKLPSAV